MIERSKIIEKDDSEYGKEYVLLSDARTYGDQRAAEAREQMRDECIKLIADESARVLATQTKQEDTAMHYSINLQTRMTCVLFPGIIDAIKELS